MLAFKQVDIVSEHDKLFTIEKLLLDSGVIALVGRNGTGKSTLLRTISGLNKRFKGSILLDDKPLENYDEQSLAQKISVVFTRTALFGNHTVREVLALGRLPYQNIFAKETEADKVIINDIVNLLGIEAYLDRLFVKLSDGEKQLVMIGRALVQETPVILLDEPGAFLDLVNRYKLMDTLRKVADQKGKLILFSTHQIDRLKAICDQVLLISDKKLISLRDKNTFSTEIESVFGLKINDDEV